MKLLILILFLFLTIGHSLAEGFPAFQSTKEVEIALAELSSQQRPFLDSYIEGVMARLDKTPYFDHEINKPTKIAPAMDDLYAAVIAVGRPRKALFEKLPAHHLGSYLEKLSLNKSQLGPEELDELLLLFWKRTDTSTDLGFYQSKAAIENLWGSDAVARLQRVFLGSDFWQNSSCI